MDGVLNPTTEAKIVKFFKVSKPIFEPGSFHAYLNLEKKYKCFLKKIANIHIYQIL